MRAYCIRPILLVVGLFVTGLPVQAEVTLTKDANGRMWFRDGAKQFKSLGVTGVRYSGDRGGDYPRNLKAANLDQESWAARAVQRLQEWGFNTIGPWSDDILLERGPLYITPNLMVGVNMIRKENAVLRKFPDVFDPQFEERVDAVIQDAYRRYQGKKLLGFFTDNELDWNIDMLDRFLQLPSSARGRKIAEQFVSAQGGSVTAALREEFLRRVAAKYYITMQKSFEKLPVKVLNLGTRFDPRPVKFHDIVAEVAGKHIQVISVNAYGKNYPEELLERMHRISSRPILVSEFSARSRDSGLPNKKGAGPLFNTQVERARWYRQYICDGVRKPYLVGFHWYRYVDNPVGGSHFGEDSNNGLVTIDDTPYMGFTGIAKQQLSGC